MAGVWWCRCAGSSSEARASAPSPSVASRIRRRPWPRTTTAVSRCAWTPSRAAASATPAAISTLPCTCRRTLRRRRAARYATRLHALASLARARFCSSAWSRSPRRRLRSQSFVLFSSRRLAPRFRRTHASLLFYFYLSHNVTLRRALGVFCASTTSLLFLSRPATLRFT